MWGPEKRIRVPGEASQYEMEMKCQFGLSLNFTVIRPQVQRPQELSYWKRNANSDRVRP